MSCKDEIKKYKKIFEISPEAIVILDKKGKVLDVNNRLFDWLNYKPEEVIGKNLLKLPCITKEGKLLALKKLAQRMVGEKIEPYNIDFIAKNGEKKIGRIIASPMRDDKGKIVADLIMISDVTEQIKEIEIREQEKEKNLKRQKLLSEITINLNKQNDFNIMVQEILKKLGEHTGVGRVYIFEDTPDGLITNNTFEWCNKGVKPQINNLQNFPYAEIPSFKKILKKKEMILSNNIKELPKDIYDVLIAQSIKSILIFPLSIKDKIIGFMGFDETKQNRVWEELDIELLKTITNNIANYYERIEIENKLKKQLGEIEKINELMVNRELKMIDLKKKLNKK
ncbi:PAS domain S-box protein [Candidatus Falkowbacteria bacterium]|jgi:PAS domain S-box-containing protein|nr:PAS domain S-box protein [Elusimicrobiaceae bacterium]MBT4433535.1 PAS domain S-box protein [Candidatus Falkowbacteria bacterium]